MKRLLRLTALSLWLFSPLRLWAGKLGTFERDATRAPEAPKAEKKTENPMEAKARKAEETEDDDDSFFVDILLLPFQYGGLSSLARVGAVPAEDFPGGVERRVPGEPVIPFLRSDVAFQKVESDVSAVDARVEAGYGPVGVEARRTRYAERSPRDSLVMTQVHVLYRMTFSKYVEVDLGLGTCALSRDGRHSGSSLTCPIRVQPTPSVGIHFRPGVNQIRGVTIKDKDLGVLFTRKFVSCAVGYRWVSNGGSTLNGPYVGVSAHY